MKGTDIYYLSGIYSERRPGQRVSQPSEIGQPAEIPADRFEVWYGNRNNVSPGKISLYAELDYLIELAGITTDSRELSKILNRLDLLSLAIKAYDYADEDFVKLEKLYFVIAAMVHNGYFSLYDNDLDNRKINLESLEREMLYQYEHGIAETDIYDIATLNYLTTEVLNRMDEPASINSIWDLGSKKKMAAKLKEAAMYYIYLFIPREQALKESSLLQKKRLTQMRTLEWQNKVDIWHNWDACINIIRSGIIAQTGKTPEKWIADARKGQAKIGSFAATAITVIKVLNAILGLISLIISIFGRKKQAPPTDKDLEASIADSVKDDLFKPPTNSIEPKGAAEPTKAGMDKTLPVLIIGGLALGMLFKK